MSKLELSAKCYELLRVLVNTYPESLYEVREELNNILIFHKENAEYEELQKMRLLEQNLSLEIF